MYAIRSYYASVCQQYYDNASRAAPTLDLLSDENKSSTKLQRVAEGADIPMKTVQIGSKSIELFKKAVGIKQTYEAMRYIRIDVASRLFRAISNDVVGQNISAITNIRNNFV